MKFHITSSQNLIQRPFKLLSRQSLNQTAMLIFTYCENLIKSQIKFALTPQATFGANISLHRERSEEGGKSHTAIPHERPCGVKQIFSSSPVDELTGDSARSSCSAASCSL